MLQPMSAVSCKLNRILVLAASLAVLLGLALSLAWAKPAYAGEWKTGRLPLGGLWLEDWAKASLLTLPIPRTPGPLGRRARGEARTAQPSNLPTFQPSSLITATKTYTLATDNDSDNQADPGDVLSYTLVITNNTVTTNTGLIISDTLDPNLSQLGLVSISPIAFDDRFNTITNPVTLSIADGPTDLFANDYPGLNPAVTGISSFGGGSLGGSVTSNAAGSTANFGSGGSLTLNTNGSFNFTPAVGFQGVFTTFYRLQNFVGPGDGLVSFIVDAAPRVASTVPISGPTLVNSTSNITLTFTENVDIATGGVTLTCDASPVSFTPALPQNGINSISLDPATNLPGLATCTVTVLAANTTDTDTNDPPNLLDGNNDNIEGDNFSFSFQVAPTANDDSYNITPHLTFTSPTSIRANDDPITVTITGFGNTLGTANSTVPNGSNSITTGLGGTLILNTNGTFTYAPPPDQRNVNDAFFYAITGGDTATVTLAIQNQNLVWFVDASAAAGGNGTQLRPFNLLTGTNSFGTLASDNTGDFIFIADGGYSCGLTLLNTQTVVGDGSSSTLQSVSGVTPVAGSTLPAFSGVDPILSNPGGDCLTLGTGNTLRGLTIGDTAASGSDLTGSNFGTLTITETTLNGTGRALNLLTGTLTIALDGLTSTSGVNNVNLQNTTGTATLASGALSGATNTAFNVSGGTVSATYSGNISQASNAALVSVSGGHNSGTLTFQTGTLNATNGTGLQFDNADGVYTFNGTTTLNGGDAGVDIINGSNGNFTFSNSTTINNPSGAAFNVNQGNGTITYNGTASKTNGGQLVSLQSRSGGSVTLAGNLTCTTSCTGVNVASNTGGTMTFSGATKTLNTGANAAVTLSSNTGATINFTNGGLDIDTTTAIGFSASGGGTITVQGTGNTINSATGTALNVTNTTIGASGLTFQGITSNGGSNTGIILDNTGSSGGLTVTGTGSAGSGGTIANKTGTNGSTATGVGIFLNNTANVSLTRMQLNDFQNFAIRGTTVSGFTLTNTVINGANGNAVNEGSVRFNELTGSANVTNSSISGGAEDNVRVINSSGTLNRITFDNVTLAANSTALGNDGIYIEANTGASINATVQNSFFTAAGGDHFQFNRQTGGASTTNDVIFTGNTISNAHPNVVPGGGGVNVGGIGGTLTYQITNNTFRDADGTALAVSCGNAGIICTGRIENNTIGVAGTANSGSRSASGIAVVNSGGGTNTTLINNNQIRQYNNHGILLQAGQDLGNPTNYSATVTNNTIANPGNINTNFNGIHLNHGTVPANSDPGDPIGDNFTSCIHIQGNTLTGSGQGVTSPNNQEFRLRQRQSTTVRLPGYGGANNNDAAVVAFIQGQNTVTAGNGAASNSVPTGGGYVGGSACPTPP